MRLSVTTPTGALVDADIDEVVVPGVLGEMGVLPGHVPILAALKPGVLSYKGGGHGGVLAVSDGFVEVVAGQGGDRVIVLVSRALTGGEVDRGAAEKEVAELDQELAGWKQAYDGTYWAARLRRDWAQARAEAAARAQAH